MLAWPIRDAFVLHLYQLRERAVVQFRHQQLLYVMGNGERPPSLPPLLMNIDEE